MVDTPKGEGPRYDVLFETPKSNQGKIVVHVEGQAEIDFLAIQARIVEAIQLNGGTVNKGDFTINRRIVRVSFGVPPGKSPIDIGDATRRKLETTLPILNKSSK